MIEQAVARVVYKGDGRTTEFPFAFPVLDRKFIYVIISDRNGREKTLTSDYYVDMDKHVVLYPGYPKGEEPAEAERPAVLEPGEKIVIYRNTPVSQLTSLGDKWPFDVCEKALDKLTMIDQENKESISRTVRLAGATEEVEVVLPPPERDTAIGWSEDEKSVINVPVKRWQEEARAAAEKAQTQASMAMTYKEESKEARSKAEQSEEKAKEYANRAVMAENKVEGYNKEAERKYNDFTEIAHQKLEDIEETGETEREFLKTKGDIYVDDFKKIATGIEEAKNEVKRAEEESKKAKDEAVRSCESTNTAKEQAETAARKSDMIKSEIVAVASEVEREKENARREAQAAKDWADKAEAEVGKVKTEVGRAQSEVEKAKTEADRALTHSTRADEAKEQAEEKAQEAKISADEAKEVLKTAMGGVDLTQYAKKESLVGLASTEYVDGRFSHIIGTSADALDTLEEIGKSLGNDADFAGTMTKELAKKADKGIVENALLGKATKEELGRKADKDAVYMKKESDAKYQAKGDYVTASTWNETFKNDIRVYPALGIHDPMHKYVYIDFPGADFIYFQKSLYGYLKILDASEMFIRKEEADTRFVKKGDLYTEDNTRIKLPNGAKIGVE